MSDSNAKELFARIDYALRYGIHIQRQYRGQETMFRFIQKHYDSLRLYYKDFFGLSLQLGGEGDQQYCFIDKDPDDTNRIPSNFRDPLSSEILIIGIFLCKLFYIDFSEVETVTAFKRTLKEEYEPFKADFYRLLGYSKSDKYTTNDDEAVEQEVDRAFRNFHNLGWLYLENDHFDVMPSLERLRLLYADEIHNIDGFVRGEEDE